MCSPCMTKPLALIFYEQLLPGSQLVNRLQDLGYRPQVVTDSQQLFQQARESLPLVILCDLGSEKTGVCRQIEQIRAETATAHIPILAFGTKKEPKLQADAREAGANLVAADEGLLAQLPQLLDQVLQVD
jgi:PleD family two-component response regulator